MRQLGGIVFFLYCTKLSKLQFTSYKRDDLHDDEASHVGVDEIVHFGFGETHAHKMVDDLWTYQSKKKRSILTSIICERSRYSEIKWNQ